MSDDTILIYYRNNSIIEDNDEVIRILNLYKEKEYIMIPISVWGFARSIGSYYLDRIGSVYHNYDYNYERMKETKKDLNNEIKEGFARIRFHPKKIAELIDSDLIDNYINSFD